MAEVTTAATVTTPVDPNAAPPAASGTETAPGAAAVPTPKPPEPKPDPMAPRFAALAKEAQKVAREKQALAAERAAKAAELKAKEDAIAARAAKADEWEKAEKAAKADPGGYLRRIYGENWYDLLTEFKLKGETSAPADMAVQAVREEARAEAERIRKENEERWNKFEAERKAAQEAERARALDDQKAIIQQWQDDTLAFVNANVEKYELIHQTGSQQLVLDVIRDTFAKSKRVLTADEAAEAVEKHLEGLVEKVTTGKKWQSRAAAKAAPTEERASGPATTLTNAAATGASIPSGGAKEDRFSRALKAMEEAEKAVAAKLAAR